MANKKSNIEDWLKQPEELHAELINGTLVYESMPNVEHGSIGGWLASSLWSTYNRPTGSHGRPGGWWLSLDVDIKLGMHGLRPDLVGWLREKHPVKPQPQAGAIMDVPDWVAEVLSPSTNKRDWGDKRLLYHQFKVTHYWILDPLAYTLTTLIWSRDDYRIGSFWGANDTVIAQPFDQVSISLPELFELEDNVFNQK